MCEPAGGTWSCPKAWGDQKPWGCLALGFERVVEPSGIEPLTSSLRTTRSPN